MKIDTGLTNDINKTEAQARFDESVKRLLSNKQILARIMKECIEEYADCSIDEIISLIEPSSANRSAETISGRNTEDSSIEDGTVRYDVLFDAALPGSNDRVGLIINVEGQNDFNPGYSLIRRGLYYCSRLISGQKGHEFEHSAFDDLVKVYSLWICMRPTKPAQNTITQYSITEKCIIGNNATEKKNYDLLSMELIGLSDASLSEAEPGIIDMLNILLDGKLEGKVKIAELERRYDISPTVEMEGEIAEMCNYSKGILQDGIEIGFNKGMSQGVRQGSFEMLRRCVKGFLSMNMSPEKIALITQTDLETILEIVKDIENGNAN